MIIREITIDDAEAAARLSAEFGYPASKETMARRIKALASRTDHVVFLACLEDVAVGWIDVGIVHHLQAEPYGEIGGFVVSEKYRSTGVGKQLIARAEVWMREHGLRRALVRSQIVREAAHRFYLREGYVRVKTSAVLKKSWLAAEKRQFSAILRWKRCRRGRPLGLLKIDPIVNVMESRSNEVLVCKLRCVKAPWRSLKALGGFPPLLF